MVSDSSTPSIDAIVARMQENPVKVAIIWRGKNYTYERFLASIEVWKDRLQEDGVGKRDVCAFQGDFSPQTCALMFALMEVGAVQVPLTREVETQTEEFLKISAAKIFYVFDAEDAAVKKDLSPGARPPLLEEFASRNHPGLVVFTSGSTGKPKAILQDIECVMEKFVELRPGRRTILFLLMDHFGGFNTFLSSFAYLGVAICPAKRTPDEICKAIESARADLLPTTPTFLNILLAGGLHNNYDLSSVGLITYGTELMSETTLAKITAIMPHAKLKQTYGLSEQGVLRSRSEGEGSTWVKIGGPGFETKIVDDILWIRSKANMVGYLNAPSPFDSEGWMCTGDEVETKGDYVQFKGRKSEVINVGGKKVYPIEVEGVLLEAPNIHNATVFGKKHPLTGQVVHAQVWTIEPEAPLDLTVRLRSFCKERLTKYKIPVRFSIAELGTQHSIRFKKIRTLDDDDPI